jgi:hypothetical protein
MNGRAMKSHILVRPNVPDDKPFVVQCPQELMILIRHREASDIE